MFHANTPVRWHVSVFSNSHTRLITWSRWSPTSTASSTPRHCRISSSRRRKACLTGCRWSRWTSQSTSGARRPRPGTRRPPWSSSPRTGAPRPGWACPRPARRGRSTRRRHPACSPSACRCPCRRWWPRPCPATASGARASCPSSSPWSCSLSPSCTPATSSSRSWSPCRRRWKIPVVACKVPFCSATHPHCYRPRALHPALIRTCRSLLPGSLREQRKQGAENCCTLKRKYSTERLPKAFPFSKCWSWKSSQESGCLLFNAMKRLVSLCTCQLWDNKNLDFTFCFIECQHGSRCKRLLRIIFSPGLPSLQALMPDGLRWSWHNNRNKVHDKCNGLDSPTRHTPHPSPWKNCLPQNQSLVPRRLEMAALDHVITNCY